MYRGAAGKLDLEKEHPLGADAADAADESATVEGGDMLKRVADEVRVQHVDDIFAYLGGNM